MGKCEIDTQPFNRMNVFFKQDEFIKAIVKDNFIVDINNLRCENKELFKIFYKVVDDFLKVAIDITTKLTNYRYQFYSSSLQMDVINKLCLEEVWFISLIEDLESTRFYQTLGCKRKHKKSSLDVQKLKCFTRLSETGHLFSNEKDG